MGQLLQAEGREADAREKMRRAEDVFPTAVPNARSAWLAVMQGNNAVAQRWSASSTFTLDDEADPVRGEYEQAVFARISALVDASPGSAALLDRLIDDAGNRGQFGRSIELLAIRAVAAHRDGNGDQARRSLHQALSLACHEGFMRVFLNEGREMQATLRDLARDRTALDGPTRLFAMDLLSRFPDDRPGDSLATPLDEPLTGRQREILELLAAGQSNREIANRLFIAEGTVKAHMHQLFGKLMARNRTEAVANARDLHLID